MGVHLQSIIGKEKRWIFPLEIEELTEIEHPNIEQSFGCRYIHSLYDKDNESFNHIDGRQEYMILISISLVFITPLITTPIEMPNTKSCFELTVNYH